MIAGLPNYKDHLIFEGISVDEAGKQHYLDVDSAYRQARPNAIARPRTMA